MESLAKYRELRHKAEVLDDNGGYDLAKAEMNPEIVKRFVGLLSDMDARVAWEPFANPDGRNFPSFEKSGINLIAYSLTAGHPDVIQKDSTIDGPDCEVDGVLFHPPYFGSTPLSNEEGELSLIEDEDLWCVMMETAADVAVHYCSLSGVICVIGRRYRHGGKEIKLDEWLVTAFCMEPIEVWVSEPDVAIVLRFKE